MPPLMASRELPTLDTGDSSSASQDVADKFESEMQAHWDELISRNMELPDGYSKVSVLIIKWEDGLDQLQVDEEVRDLKDLFESTFKYETQVLALGPERTQLQLISGVTSFAHKGGGDENLLIVYYAGHGVFHKDKHLLELVPTNEDLPPGFNLNKVFWNPAEKLLIDEVEADVLSIMDCCFSSDLVRNVVETGRTFEMLSASGVGQVTAAPGEKSFTRALINCMKTLSESSSGGSFTTRDVFEKIQKERPLTPPALWRRIPVGSRHIRLCPMKNDQKSGKGSVDHDRRGYLQLGFVLKQDGLSKNQIEELTRHIPKTFNGCRVPVREIKWLGFRKIEKRRSLQLADVAEWLIQQRRRNSHRSPVTPVSMNSTGSLKRKRSDATLSPDMYEPVENRRGHTEESPITDPAN